jgi:CRISPR/Cas system CSM-associated protein Csm3 (group 7 of RAMP superfamily)
VSAVLGRPVDTLLRVRGWLRVRTPLHVGGAGGDPNGALAVAVDGLGRPYVPGSGLAGAFRAWYPGEPDPPWGYVRPGTQDGAASRVIVHDALLHAPDAQEQPGEPLDPAWLEARTSVGIDRRTGTSAEGFLHERVVVPAGAWLRLELDVESTVDTVAADRAVVAALVEGLAAGAIRLGAARSRGLGRVELDPATLQVGGYDLTTRSGLLALLEGEDAEPAELGEPAPAGREVVSIRIDWHATGPVLARASTTAPFADSLPLVSATSAASVRMVLPGSSLKGALCSRAAFIERTVRGLDAPAPDADDADDAVGRRTAFRAQLSQPGLRAVLGLFGTAADGGPGSHDFAASTPSTAGAASTASTAGADGHGDDSPGSGSGNSCDGNPGGGHADAFGAGAVGVDDCYATADLDRAAWQQMQQATAAPGWLPGAGFAVADHVAIDRWTGGAAEGRLYSVLEPTSTWAPIQITVDLARLRTALAGAADAAFALLLLVLRDLRDGRVAVGYGTHRGFGHIGTDAITLTGPDWPQSLPLDKLLTGPQADQYTAAWQEYLDREEAP